jgi:SIR2-like domain
LAASGISIYDLESSAIIDGLAEGKVIPFLGAGVNLCDRPDGAKWQHGVSAFLPSGYELAEHLASKFRYMSADRDLSRVCQFVVETRGLAPLYSYLREIFAIQPQTTKAHRFLAGVPAVLRAKGCESPNLLIVTTNYDDLVEAAFEHANEPLEVVTYIADSPKDRGKFMHIFPNGERVLITRPNEYRDLSVKRSSILLKIHGAIDRSISDNDSYVITEDHYIDFLTRTDLSNLVPVLLAAQLRTSHFLFMGYSLRDWNLRVILQRIWEEQRLGYNSWAVQKSADALDQRFWSRRNVQIIATGLSEFIDALDQRIRE